MERERFRGKTTKARAEARALSVEAERSRFGGRGQVGGQQAGNDGGDNRGGRADELGDDGLTGHVVGDPYIPGGIDGDACGGIKAAGWSCACGTREANAAAQN